MPVSRALWPLKGRARLVPFPDGGLSERNVADPATHRPTDGTILVLALPGFVTLGKVLNLSEPCLPPVKWEQECHLPH